LKHEEGKRQDDGEKDNESKFEAEAGERNQELNLQMEGQAQAASSQF